MKLEKIITSPVTCTIHYPCYAFGFLPSCYHHEISRPKSRLHHNYSASFVSFWPSSRVIPCLFACLLTQRVWISSQHVLAKRVKLTSFSTHNKFQFFRKLYNDFLMCSDAQKEVIAWKTLHMPRGVASSHTHRTQTAISLRKVTEIKMICDRMRCDSDATAKVDPNWNWIEFMLIEGEKIYALDLHTVWLSGSAWRWRIN